MATLCGPKPQHNSQLVIIAHCTIPVLRQNTQPVSDQCHFTFLCKKSEACKAGPGGAACSTHTRHTYLQAASATFPIFWPLSSPLTTLQPLGGCMYCHIAVVTHPLSAVSTWHMGYANTAQRSVGVHTCAIPMSHMCGPPQAAHGPNTPTGPAR